MDVILKNVLKRIKPTKKEKEKIKEIVDFVLSKIPNSNLGGSVAKNTFLRGKNDIDFFVKFDTEDKMKDLYFILKDIFDEVKVIHGSRDYYQVYFKNYTLEFIPILNIKDPLDFNNTTDVSLFHVDYINTYLDKKEDVLLLKKFLKANNLYGAESWISGFSGYVCELLIVYYGTFKNMIKQVSKWKGKVYIDIRNYYTSPSEALQYIREAKNSSLLIIDPVLKYRNVAAGVSESSYEKFVKLCRLFLKKPSIDFFKKDILFDKIKDKVLKFKVKSKDKIYLSKLRSKLDIVFKEMNKYGFKCEYGLTKNFYWFLIKKNKLPKKYTHWGPKIDIKEGAKYFKIKWGKKVKEKNGRLYVILEREFTQAKEYLIYLLRKYVNQYL